MKERIFITNSPTLTQDLGRQIGEKVEPGAIIALIGELGCGKTCFAKGVCAGVGVPDKHVMSPSFTLVNEYFGKFPVFHIDLYRVNDIGESLEIGLLDYLARAETGIVIIEWAEKVISLLTEDHLQVRFSILSPKKRRITLLLIGEKFFGLLTEVNER